ncbi:MAG: nickel pincer cofactor biosynthesis protein LarB [Proteobacteria bacterium]|nr:nickel pincer cofactor biosynthesis protein LarB [Pseudomonadota bacterium]MBI3498261.1 nickel pincer cofactor biosynthesis protein LarB [Pseudomonadota bacterium]
MTETGINLDFDRTSRLGFDEAMFCSGKTVGQIAAILERVAERGGSMLLTRLEPAVFALLPEETRRHLDYEALSGTAYFGPVAPLGKIGQVAVVGAGTSDMAVCREVVRTLFYHGVKASEVYDVGVAGLWRLLERVPEIVRHPVVIAVAGMDAALVSVLGGLVPGLVIAVPTSSGYGVANRGETALHAALASCAPGVPVVNIDNGYGAACAALRALRAADWARSEG